MKTKIVFLLITVTFFLSCVDEKAVIGQWGTSGNMNDMNAEAKFYSNHFFVIFTQKFPYLDSEIDTFIGKWNTQIGNTILLEFKETVINNKVTSLKNEIRKVVQFQNKKIYFNDQEKFITDLLGKKYFVEGVLDISYRNFKTIEKYINKYSYDELKNKKELWERKN